MAFFKVMNITLFLRYHIAKIIDTVSNRFLTELLNLAVPRMMKKQRFLSGSESGISFK